MDKVGLILELDLGKEKDWLHLLENSENFRILKLLNCQEKDKTVELLSSQRFATAFNQSQYLFVLQIYSNDPGPISLDDASSILHKIKAHRPVIVHWISTKSSKSHIFYKQPNEKIKIPTKEKSPINWIVASIFRDDGFIQNPCDFMLDSELELMEEAIQTGDVLAIRFLRSLSDKYSMGHEQVNLAATSKGIECLKAVLDLPINISGVDEQCRENSFKQLNLASNPEPFFMAIKSQNLELVRFITEVNSESTLHSFLTDAVDHFYKNGEEDILSYLIFELDAPFPKIFDKDSVNEELKEKTDMRDLLHEDIANDNVKKVECYITKYPNLRRAYSSTNSSALRTAIVYNHFHKMYPLLKLNDFVIGNDFIESLTDYQKQMIKDANIKSFTRTEESHLQFLISKTRKSSGEAMKEFSKRCQRLYRKLDDITHISLILKVIEHCESLDIILDFEEESVKAMDPTMSENTKGSCDYKQGRIYIGAKKREEAILGTIAHELTHLALQVLFDNDSNPYNNEDSARLIELQEIVRGLRFRQKPSHRIIEAVFASYKDPKVWHSEIIVRVPQILAEYGEELGTETLTEQAGDLFEWYEERLVPQMRKFIEDPYKYKNKVKIRRLNSKFGLFKVISDKSTVIEFCEDRLIDCSEKVSVYIRSNVPKLTQVNIFQCLLATYKTFNEISSAVLFLQVEHLSIELIKEAFSLNAVEKFVVLDSCESKIDYESVHFLVKGSSDVIIAGNGREELKKYMRLINDDRYLWKHLKSTSRNKLLDTTATCQGIDVPLKDMVNQIKDIEHQQMLDISQLLERDLKIGRALEQTTIIGTTLFIKRTFSRRETMNKNIIEFTEFYFVRSEEEFKMAEERGLEAHFIENSVWKKSRGNISSLMEFLEEGKTVLNSEEFLQRADYENVTLISNVAGMGKSVVIGHLAKEMKVSNPVNWVIQIPLHYHANTLSHSLSSESEFENFVQVEVLQLDNFGKAIFTQKGSIRAYLFDGFDEIGTKLQESLIEMLQTLRNCKSNRIWITTRPHEKERLECKFNTLSYSIEPFTIEDQSNFLIEYWKQNNVDGNIESNYLLTSSYSVLDGLANIIDDKLLEVTGVPLQMTLVGDYTLEIVKSSKEKVGLYFEHLSITNLYKSFIDRKIKIYFVEKLELKLTNYSISQQVENWTEETIMKHTFLSFKIDAMPVVDKALDLVDLTKYGIISIIAGNPVFIHKTFSEYLVARHIVSWLNIQDETLCLEVARVYLTEKRFGIVRMFVNQSLENANSEILLSLIKSLKLDQFKNIWELAISEGLFNIFNLLSHQMRKSSLYVECMVNLGKYGNEIWEKAIESKDKSMLSFLFNEYDGGEYLDEHSLCVFYSIAWKRMGITQFRDEEIILILLMVTKRMFLRMKPPLDEQIKCMSTITSLQQIRDRRRFELCRISVLEFVVGLIWGILIRSGAKAALEELSTWKDHFKCFNQFWPDIIFKIFGYCESAERIVLFADWARHNCVDQFAYSLIVRNTTIWKKCSLTMSRTIGNIVKENTTKDFRNELLLDANLWRDAFMEAPFLLKVLIEWSTTDLTTSDVIYICLRIKIDTQSCGELWSWATKKCERLDYIIHALKQRRLKYSSTTDYRLMHYVKPWVVFYEAAEHFLKKDPWSTSSARRICDSTTRQEIEQLWNQRKQIKHGLAPDPGGMFVSPQESLFSEDHLVDVFYEQIAWISQLNNARLMYPWKEIKITNEHLNLIVNKLLAKILVGRSENELEEKMVGVAFEHNMNITEEINEITAWSKQKGIPCDILVKLWITLTRDIIVMGPTNAKYFTRHYENLTKMCKQSFELIQHNNDISVEKTSLIYLLCHLQIVHYSIDNKSKYTGCLDNFVDFANTVDALQDEFAMIFMDECFWKMLTESQDISLLLKAWRVGKKYITQGCIRRLLSTSVSAYDLLFWPSTLNLFNNFKKLYELPHMLAIVNEVWHDEETLANLSIYEMIMRHYITNYEAMLESGLVIMGKSQFLSVTDWSIFILKNVSEDIKNAKMIASIMKSDIWLFCARPGEIIPKFMDAVMKQRLEIEISTACKVLLRKQYFWDRLPPSPLNINAFLACARLAFNCTSTSQLFRNPRAVETVFQNRKILHRSIHKDKNFKVTRKNLKAVLFNENLWVTAAGSRDLSSLSYLIDMSIMFLDRRFILVILENINIWSAGVKSAEHIHLLIKCAVSIDLTISEYENIFNHMDTWTELSTKHTSEAFKMIAAHLRKNMLLKPEALRYIDETLRPHITTQINRADEPFGERHHLLELSLGSIRGRILEKISSEGLSINDFPFYHQYCSYSSTNEIFQWTELLFFNRGLPKKLLCKLLLNEDIWKFCVKSIDWLNYLWKKIRLHCFEWAKQPLLSLRVWFHAAESYKSLTLLISICDEMELCVDDWRKILTTETLWTRVTSRGCPFTFECLWGCAKKFTSDTTQLDIISNENVWFPALPWPSLIQKLLAVREIMKFDEDGVFLQQIWMKAAKNNYTGSFSEIYNSTKHLNLLQSKLFLPELWLASITSVFQIRLIIDAIDENFGFDERLPSIMFSHDLWLMACGNNLSSVASLRVILAYGIKNFNSSLSLDILSDGVIWNFSVRSMALFKLLVQWANKALTQTAWKEILLDEKIWHYFCENGQVESLELLISCATSYTDIITRKQIWSYLRFTTTNERSVEIVEKLTAWVRFIGENDDYVVIRRILTADVWINCLERGDISSFGDLCKCAETNLTPTDFVAILNNQDIWVTAATSSNALSLLSFWSNKLKACPIIEDVVNKHQFWLNIINDCASFDLIHDKFFADDAKVLRDHLILNMNVWIEATNSYQMFTRLITFCDRAQFRKKEWKSILFNPELWIQAIDEDKTPILLLMCKKITSYPKSCQSLLRNTAIWCKAVQAVSLVSILLKLLKDIPRKQIRSNTKCGNLTGKSILKSVILDKTFWTEASLNGRTAAIMVLWDEIRRILGDKFCEKVLCESYIWESVLPYTRVTRLLVQFGNEMNIDGPIRKFLNHEMQNLLLISKKNGYMESFIFLNELFDAPDTSILVSKDIWSDLFSNTFHVIKMIDILNKNKITGYHLEEFLAREDMWVEFVQSGQYNSLRVLFDMLSTHDNFKKLLLNPNIWRESAHSVDIVSLLIEFGISIKLSAEEWSRVVFDEELWKVAARNCNVVTLDLLWNFGLTLNNRSTSENILFNTEIWQTEKCPETLLMLHENLVAMFQFD